MTDITLFCNDPECVCEDKCCQDCTENATCDNKCEGIKYKEKVYKSDEFLLQELAKAVDKHDDWIVAVALERIKTGIIERNTLAEQVQALEKVAEAAQVFLAALDLAERTGARVDMPPVQWQALYRLRKAVDDLTALGGGE